jgi:poly(A) polymerase
MFKINTNFIPSSSNAFIVGGTVRDLLIGSSPKDIDIVTLSDPRQLAQKIAKNTRKRVIELGKPGKKIFRIVTAKQIYDIAPANGNTIEEDLKKRDFTINAMAISLGNGNAADTIIDPHNGRGDLHTKTIRMISSDNLLDDPVRLLRAYRIASGLDFNISRDTSRAIHAASARINTSAGERIKDELFKLFATPCSYRYVLMMNNTGLLTEIFPELLALKSCSQNAFHQYNAFDHTLKAYDFIEKILHTPDAQEPEIADLKPFLPSFSHYALLKYTILLHDIGKPRTRSIDPGGRIHFYGHEKTGAEMADRINRRLRLSNDEQKYIIFIIRNHLKPLSLFTAYNRNRLSRKAIFRFFLKCGHMTKDLLVHTAADLYGKGFSENTRAFAEFLNYLIGIHADSFKPENSAPPLINGEDLINEFNLEPSPLFSKILGQIEEERFLGNITTRKEAFIHVKKFLNLA